MRAIDHIALGYRGFARFSGRTPRSEYWVFSGFLMAATVLTFMAGPMLALAFVVVSALPGIAASIRRLHDAGRSGWWLLPAVVIVPGWLLIWAASAAAALAVRSDPLDDERYFLAASVVMFVAVGALLFLLISPSQPGHNRYGPNPHEVPQ